MFLMTIINSDILFYNEILILYYIIICIQINIQPDVAWVYTKLIVFLLN